MNRNQPAVSVIPYPVGRISNMPVWRDEGAAMPRWRDAGAAIPQWHEESAAMPELREEDLPVRRLDASDEWDDKWLRPLFIPPARVQPSQPAEAKVAPEKCVVAQAPAKRADTNVECDAKWVRSKFATIPSPLVAPSEPTKAENACESMEPDAIPLQLRFLRWLFRVNQNKATRYSTPDLVAYYFTGGSPRSFRVANMSATGLYLLTAERWAPGTLIQMTLHKKNGSGGSPKDSIRVLSEVVRLDKRGAGFSFVPPDYRYLCAYGLGPEEVRDRDSIERFMRKVGVRAS